MKKIVLISGVIAAMVVGFWGSSRPNNTAVASDCSDNAVITCGFTSIGQLRAKYNADQPAGTKTIYTYFGMSSSTINQAAYKTGYVTKAGEVVVDGKVVADNALTVGRQDMPGSTKHVVDGTTFYTRTPSVSFLSDKLSVIAFFDVNGRFIGATMFDCGNPVMATNKVIPPVFSCDSLQATKINRDTFDFRVAHTAKNGATFKNFDLAFGDGKTVVNQTSSPVRHAYSAPGTYTAIATVRFNVGDTVKTVTCQTTVIVLVAPAPSVSIEKTVRGTEHQTVAVNEPFPYELTITNTGNTDLTKVMITDDAPTGVQFISADKGMITENRYRYTIPGVLKVGASVKVVINAKLTKYVAGAITNKACVDASEVTGNPDDCDTAQVDTPKMIEVCDTTNDTVVTIKEKDFVAPRYTKDLDACAKIIVCDSSTGKIVTIVKNKQTSTQSKNFDACTDITVCQLSNTATVVIKKTAFDSALHTTDMSRCAPKQPPLELPRTGVSDVLSGTLGLGGLVGAGYAYIASRRTIQ